jgi:hypothetical protein
VRGKLILFLAGVLLGAGPVAYQYWQLDQRVTVAETRSNVLDEQLRLARLRNQLAGIIFQIQDQNFGRARELATNFFGDLGEAASLAEVPPVKEQLEKILSRRDELTGDLASLSPQSVAKFREIYAQFAQLPG